MSYELLKLGDICFFINGDRGKNYPSKSSFVERGIPFINAGNIDNYALNDETLNFITKDKYDCLSSGKIEGGDIIFCLRGSLGKFAYINHGRVGAIASSLVIIRAKEDLYIKYLFYYLRSNLCKREIKNFENGAAQPNLSARDLKKFKIPLPPLETQKKIVEILDKAQLLIDQRKEQIKEMDNLVQSLFYDMFGDPVSNPMGWEVKKLIDIAIFENGDRSKNYPNKNSIVKKSRDAKLFLSSGDNKGIRFKVKDSKYISSDKFDSLKSGKCKKGDVLMTLRGNGTGNTCVFECEYEEGFINAQMVIIRLKEDILNYFLVFQMKTKSMLNKIMKISSGSAQPQLSAASVKNLDICLPPEQLQYTFTERVRSIETQKELLIKSRSGLEDNFNSLMQRAFKGELVQY